MFALVHITYAQCLCIALVGFCLGALAGIVYARLTE